MFGTDSAFASSSESYSASWSLEDNIEIHAENACEGIILDSQINVLLDTKSKAAGVWKVSFPQLSILDLQTSF